MTTDDGKELGSCALLLRLSGALYLAGWLIVASVLHEVLFRGEIPEEKTSKGETSD